MISFACPSCSRAYRTPNETAGKRTMCPNCQALLTVPALAESVEPPPVRPAKPAEIRPLRVLTRKASAPARPKRRATIAPDEVGVLCERCLTVFGGKPGCRVPCPRCEEPCVTPTNRDVLGA